MVSGGGSGIGLDVAQQLLALGSNVLIASRDEEKIRDATRELAARKPTPRTTCRSTFEFQATTNEELKFEFSGWLIIRTDRARNATHQPAARTTTPGTT